jgi:signal transduction histidine kinase
MSQIMAEDEPGITVSVMKERASIIHNDASRLHKLLSNLLDWSKLERGLIRFNPEKLPLSGLVADSIESIEEQARIKGVELIVRIPSDIIVIADRNAFNSIIRNLVSNAVKFTRKGGEVVISARYPEDKKIEISVKDNGIGMPPEMLESIFRIDARTNRNGTDGEPSTGLGLILCKDFIEISSGRIWATSNEAEGSAFFFTLPSGL